MDPIHLFEIILLVLIIIGLVLTQEKPKLLDAGIIALDSMAIPVAFLDCVKLDPDGDVCIMSRTPSGIPTHDYLCGAAAANARQYFGLTMLTDGTPISDPA